ncbi:phage holin family protein [Chroococcidiopsis sp [FACHB-1243]]|uniref:phage holin family protein n=1 Tax=Chroococcidiopsis sp. [FACHB-1243] TaxID=2692781 RepID=UPI001F54AE34|nr:phage holin family protein [Chroococcidiopsis sp. [FACHB-1243]]
MLLFSAYRIHSERQRVENRGQKRNPYSPANCLKLAAREWQIYNRQTPLWYVLNKEEYHLVISVETTMIHFLLTWLVTAVSLLITANLVNGFIVTNFAAALIAAVVIGLVNAIIRPILIVLTLPLTILTLGLFLFVVNGISIWIASVLSPGFTVAGLLPGLLGSIVLTLVAGIINFVVERVVQS